MHVLIIVLLTLLAGGCGDDMPSCTSDFQCGAGRVCVGGTCVTKAPDGLDAGLPADAGLSDAPASAQDGPGSFEDAPGQADGPAARADGPADTLLPADAAPDSACAMSCDSPNPCAVGACVSGRCVTYQVPLGAACGLAGGQTGVCANINAGGETCVQCGGAGQRCCAGAVCNPRFECQGAGPSSTGVCSPSCGSQYNLCCAPSLGPPCNTGLTCGPQGRCV